MLEKPDLPDQALATWLAEHHHLRAAEVTFLPLGADLKTAVYRVGDDAGRSYFLKLRDGPFDDVGVIVPRLLHDHGVSRVIPPIATRDGRLFARLDQFSIVLYPFVDGTDGYVTALSDEQWRALGETLRGVHTLELPSDVADRVPRDTFSSSARDLVRDFLARVAGARFDEPTAAALVALLRAEEVRIRSILDRADALAAVLADRQIVPVLCHGDLHAGNVLLTSDDALYLVDWDTLVLAPAERDFELIGDVWGGERAAAGFWAAYGPYRPDPTTLAYYRYRRLIEDIAVTCEQLLLTDEGGANRQFGLDIIVNAFRPDGYVDLLCRLDRQR